MLFADFDWNRVLIAAVVGGVIGGIIGLVKKLSGAGKTSEDETR